MPGLCGKGGQHRAGPAAISSGEGAKAAIGGLDLAGMDQGLAVKAEVARPARRPAAKPASSSMPLCTPSSAAMPWARAASTVCAHGIAKIGAVGAMAGRPCPSADHWCPAPGRPRRWRRSRPDSAPRAGVSIIAQSGMSPSVGGRCDIGGAVHLGQQDGVGLRRAARPPDRLRHQRRRQRIDPHHHFAAAVSLPTAAQTALRAPRPWPPAPRRLPGPGSPHRSQVRAPFPARGHWSRARTERSGAGGLLPSSIRRLRPG